MYLPIKNNNSNIPSKLASGKFIFLINLQSTMVVALSQNRFVVPLNLRMVYLLAIGNLWFGS